MKYLKLIIIAIITSILFTILFIFIIPPSSTVFGVLLAASGTMLALTMTAQASHSSALDGWIQFYGGIVHRGLQKPEEFSAQTYEQGMEILTEKFRSTRYVKNACYLILCALLSSTSALCISLVSVSPLQSIALKTLWSIGIITLLYGGFLLALVTYKSIETDSRRLNQTIQDLELARDEALKAKQK